MVLASSTSSIHIQGSLPINAGQTTARTPTSVTIHPVALFSILDHYLRRPNDPSQQGSGRVIGTLLGYRNSTTTSASSSTSGEDTVSSLEIEIRSAFAVLHSESNDHVAVDVDYYRGMVDLYSKVGPGASHSSSSASAAGGKEVVLGWYSTSPTLNTNSALIQNFYSTEVAPNRAIHVAFDMGVDGDGEPGIKAYISSPVGVYPKAENTVFVPIPITLKVHDAERSGIDLLLSAASSSPTLTSPTQPQPDLITLESALQNISQMLDRVHVYVKQVLSGERKGDPAIGRYLMDHLGISIGEELFSKQYSPYQTQEAGAGGKASGGFMMGSLQDTLMIGYLANIVRAQAEVSSRLALVSA